MPTADPSSLSLDCPHCRRRLYKKRAEEWCAETRLLKLLGGRVYLKCDQCRADVPVPWLEVVPPGRTRREVPTADRTLEVRPGSAAPAPLVGRVRVTGSGA